MKKVELLSPAGDMECLRAALYNGCDAVYISGRMYGARKFAKNFSLEEIDEACKLCHLYGVRVYVTVNTLIYDEEVDNFIDYIRALHKIGVDAVIMQDLGMIDLVCKKFPNLEVHASTQCDNHNIEKVKLLKDLGVKRVVLARELSLKEINDIDVPIEKEVFVHGSLCVSYSGLCLFSSVILGRSGNQGACAGMCRLPYEMYEDNKRVDLNGDYLFSMKDLCSFDILKDILSSSITSLKIEGRMKSASYVGYITRVYRKLIDKFYAGEDLILTKEELEDLKKIYYRGFTKGFLGDDYDTNLVSIGNPNHIGVPIGKVLDTTSKIKILLSDKLTQGDGIRFSNKEGMIVNYLYNENGLLVSSLDKGSICYVDNKVNLKEKGVVNKTTDFVLNKNLSILPKRFVPITFDVSCQTLEKLKISISDGINTFTVVGSEVLKASNRPVTESDISQKLNKLGDTPFSIQNISFNMDSDAFVPIKEINEIRRELTTKLMDCRSNKRVEFIEKDFNYELDKVEVQNKYVISVCSEEQLLECLKYNVDIFTKNYNLYKKYKDKGVSYKTERVVNKYKNDDFNLLLISDLGACNFYKGIPMISDVYMNVTNSYTVRLYRKLGISLVGLSVEMKKEEIGKLVSSYMKNYGVKPNVMVYSYGKLELMIMKYCPVKSLVVGDGLCRLCYKHDYSIKDRNGKVYSFMKNETTNSLLHHETLDLIDDDNKLTKYLAFTNENIKEVRNVLNRIKVQ